MRRSRDDDDLPMSGVRPVHEDVRRELEFHIEQRARELVATGHSPEQAMAAAREYFGDRERVEAECREIESRRRATRRRSRRWEALQQDARLGLRVLRKSPGFTLAATLTLALGIGANAAVFSIVNKVILQPLPYAEPDRLVWMVERHGEKGWGSVPWANFLDLEQQAKSFSSMASMGASTVTLLGAGSPLRVRAAAVSAGFFRVFPVRPVMGRLPAPDEYRRGANPVAVVSYRFWRNELGAPASLEGVHLRMDRDHEVVGVLPPGFDFPDGSQVWGPVELFDQSMSRTSHNWDTVGRLAPGATVEGATREVDGILARLRRMYYPDFDATGSIITPLQEHLTATARTPLYLLLGASAMVLLAACTNLASAMLARGTARAGELAVRAALGATRLRLVRQLVTESAMLSVLGCAVGLGLASLLLRVLPLVAPEGYDLTSVRIDTRVLVFAAGVTIVTALLFGLLPALRLSGGGGSAMLREGGRGTADPRRLRAWSVLVAAEVSLAVVLLTGSALLIRSFARVMDTRLGFDPARVVTADVDLPAITYADSGPGVAAFHERVLDALHQQPAIDAVGFVNVLPLRGANPSGAIEVEGKPLDPRGAFNGYSVYRVVGGDFFRAAGIPLVRGRLFGAGDDAGSAPVVIVNETFARKEWPDGEAIGKRVRPAGMDGRHEPWFVVVGVVGDSRGASVTEPFRQTYYFPYRQRPAYRSRSVSYVARGPTDESSLGRALRGAALAVDPQVPVEVRAYRQIVDASVADRRFTMLVLGAFAGVALLLAVIGIYAVISYSVAQRTREIGVRLALGATPTGVRLLVLRAAMGAVLPGLVVGTLLALAGSGALRSLLYGVTPTDRIALLASVAVLAIAAVGSSFLPATRATRVDPMIAIRTE